jgi:hypothetical protein
VDEVTWLACEDPTPMMRFLRRGWVAPQEVLESPQGRAYDRKARLFTIACCRRLWPLLDEPLLREAVLTAARHADGQATDQEMRAAVQATRRFGQDPLGSAVHATAQSSHGAALFTASGVALAAARAVAAVGRRPVPPTASFPLREPPHGAGPFRRRQPEYQTEALLAEQAVQCLLLRDIFGNPFHPRPVVAPSLLGWRDGLIVWLAEAIYENRILPSGHFDEGRVAVLADALEDSGCQDVRILGHLRGPGPHVRGCYIVDLLLGLE